MHVASSCQPPYNLLSYLFLSSVCVSVNFYFASGGWGYGPKFQAAKTILKTKFPGNDVIVTGIADRGTTGNFEISIDGKIVHSKKHQGQGFFHSNKSSQKVVFAELEAAGGKAIEGDVEDVVLPARVPYKLIGLLALLGYIFLNFVKQ